MIADRLLGYLDERIGAIERDELPYDFETEGQLSAFREVREYLERISRGG